MTGSPESTTSAANVARRKLRVLAVHGGYSNSNIMKFQLAQLRKTLGKDVEWVLPDATIPLHPYAEAPNQNLFPMGTAFETRLAQGKPFVSWWVLHMSSDGKTTTDPDMWNISCSDLLTLIEQQEPIDLVIGFSQGALLLTFVSLQLKRAGRPAPWQLAVLFCPSYPTREMVQREFTQFLSTPVIHISSTTDPHYSLAKETYAKIIPEHLWTVIEHGDGYAFPSTQPRAAQIYQLIAEEVKKHCSILAAEAPVRESVQPAATTAEQANHPASRKQEESSSNPAQEDKTVSPVSPEELAKLLLAGTTLVVDTRQPETRGSRPFPGCDLKDDLSFAALQQNSKDIQRRLLHLQKDGRKVIAISRLGDFDHEYCKLLVGSGLPASRVHWLAGGLRAWASWELDRPSSAAQVRSAAGLPARREAGIAPVRAGELAEMLREGSCAVADAREASESRGRAFPGAYKGISFLTLRNRPEEARVRLAKLREEGNSIVVISVTGGRCWQYCAMLVDHFGFEEASVRRLDGGLRGWVAWERENQEAAEDIRRQYGLPRARCSLASDAKESRGAAERELSVDAVCLYS